jgi:hypothetical protein
MSLLMVINLAGVGVLILFMILLHSVNNGFHALARARAVRIAREGEKGRTGRRSAHSR